MAHVSPPDDARVDQLRSQLVQHGMELDLDAGLQALSRAEAESRGAWDAGMELVLALVSDGVGIDRLLDYGVQAALRCRGESAEPVAQWLEPLGSYVRTLHGGDVALWNAVSTGLQAFAEVEWSSCREFSACLARFGGLLVTLEGQGVETDRIVNYGIGALCQGIGGAAWALEPAMRVAERVGATGGEPGWIWQECVREWAGVLVPEGGGGQPVFERAMGQLGDFLDRAPAAGMSAGSRLSDGLATFARYGPEMADHLEEWLELTLALIRSMAEQDMSPYLPIGQGLGGLVGHVRADELGDVLGFVVRLADRGLHPGGVLYEAFVPAASTLGTPEAIEIGRRLAEIGFDPFHVLRDAAAAVGACAYAWPDAEREALRSECLGLLVDTATALQEIEANGDKYFQDAVPYHAQRAGADAGRLLEALRLGALLAQRGLRPGMTMAYGWPTVLDLAEEHDWIHAEGRACLEALSAESINPETTLSRAFPVLAKAADGSAEEFANLRRTLVEVAGSLARSGADPADVLYRDVSAMAEVGESGGATGPQALRTTLERFQSLLQVLSEGGVSPKGFLERGLPAAARAAQAQPSRLAACFESVERMARRGIDGASLLEQAAEFIAGVDREEPERFIALLRALETEAVGDTASRDWALRPAVEAAAVLSGGEPSLFGSALATSLAGLAHADMDAMEPPDGVRALASALPLLAEIASSEPARFGELIAIADRQGEEQVQASRHASDLLWYGLRAIRSVAAGRLSEGIESLELLSALLIQEQAELGRALVRPSRAYGQGFWGTSPIDTLSRVAGDDAAGFCEALPLMMDAARIFSGEGSAESFGQLIRFASAVPPATLDGFRGELRWLLDRLSGDGVANSAGSVTAGLDLCRDLVVRFPTAWQGLLRPTLVVHGQRSAGLLHAIRWIGDRWVRQASDFDVVADIVTQFGVRVTEILHGLLLPGLQDGGIVDLTAERESLLKYLREVPMADSAVYREYRRIQRDASLSEAQKRAQVEALQANLHALAQALRSGSISEEQAQDPLLALVLFYVFPPGTSGSRDRHHQVFQQFADHADHLAARSPGEHGQCVYELPQGAWQMRGGAQIDRGPWDLVMAVREAADEDHPGDTTLELGWDLLSRWAEGRIGRDQTKRELLARILRVLRQAGFDLPLAADSPVQLIECKEFLGDHVRDVVEQGLIAARDQDAGRYERLVRDKIAPDTQIGSGLVKSMHQLAQGLGAGRVEPADAELRLEGQLRHFQYDAGRLLGALVACESRDEVRALLQALAPLPVEIEAGKEQSRLLADFVGKELRAMQRELFGGSGQPAKLVYENSDSAPPLEITLELTKRKAHAPIGLCEGVCVATDVELWERSEFFQVVFWGPDGIAAGGMHVLVVSQDGQEFLALPGINPTPRLLDTVEPAGILDFALDYAWRLARHWGCAGVWVPTSAAIHSNRRAIQLEMHRRQWPTHSTQQHPFSFRPYRYSFAEVYAVPEPEGAEG